MRNNRHAIRHATAAIMAFQWHFALLLSRRAENDAMYFAIHIIAMARKYCQTTSRAGAGLNRATMSAPRSKPYYREDYLLLDKG